MAQNKIQPDQLDASIVTASELSAALATKLDATADLVDWSDKTAPSGTAVGTTDTQTLENKRITPRVLNTNTFPLSFNADDYDHVYLNNIYSNFTVNAPTGTPVNGQKLLLRFMNDGNTYSITWNAIFRPFTTALPSISTGGKDMYVGCVYNTARTKWDVVSVATAL